jgi:Protein of unknown function (DUF3107)
MTGREHNVDVRIGVTQTPREIEVDLGDGADADKLAEQVTQAIESDSGMLWLTDKRGRRVGIVAAKVAYIEIDAGAEPRRVGFGNGTATAK